MKGINKSIKNPEAIPADGWWICTPRTNSKLADWIKLFGYFEDLAVTNNSDQTVTAYAGIGDDDFITVTGSRMLCLIGNTMFDRFRIHNDGDSEIKAGKIIVTLSKDFERKEEGNISREWI